MAKILPLKSISIYAKIQREAERLDTRSSAEAEEQHFGGLFRRVVGGHKIATTPDNHSEKGSESEKNGGQMAVQPATHSSRLGDQQTVAYHALRVASWQSVFYLIVRLLELHQNPESDASVSRRLIFWVLSE